MLRDVLWVYCVLRLAPSNNAADKTHQGGGHEAFASRARVVLKRVLQLIPVLDACPGVVRWSHGSQ